MNYIMSVNNVTKKIKGNYILNNVCFNINEGSIFVVLGPNGSGKTTLFNIIMNVLKKSSGDVKISNNRVGYVFQENLLDDVLSIYDNLYIRGCLSNINKKELKQKINELSDLLGMNSYLYKEYRKCSGGEKRMASLARALLINPAIIIMDEPTVALDIDARNKFWKILLDLNRKDNLTIVFASHYIEEASLANNLCILKKGKVVYSGTYSELIEKNNIKRLVIYYKNKKEIKSIENIEEGIRILNKLDTKKINYFSIENIGFEEIFLRMVNNENTNI